MRFRRRGRFEFTDTARKRAAVLRKHRNECAALPLFAAEVASGQPSVDDVMQARAEASIRVEQQWRAYRAADWRRARRALAALEAGEQSMIRAYWQRCGWPADPMYLLCMLNMHATGRLEVPVGCMRSTP